MTSSFFISSISHTTRHQCPSIHYSKILSSSAAARSLSWKPLNRPFLSSTGTNLWYSSHSKAHPPPPSPSPSEQPLNTPSSLSRAIPQFSSSSSTATTPQPRNKFSFISNNFPITSTAWSALYSQSHTFFAFSSVPPPRLRAGYATVAGKAGASMKSPLGGFADLLDQNEKKVKAERVFGKGNKAKAVGSTTVPCIKTIDSGGDGQGRGVAGATVVEASTSGGEEGITAKKAWFQETSDKAVGYWLLGSSALVFGIVVLGGLTRLTESGLSITEWKPVTGTLPPLSESDWEENYSKYKDSPEYRILNPNMTLSEFKFIYYMEWAHRLWGRVIGLSFVLPAAYFIARGRVSPKIAKRLVGISTLIGFQGFIGWWMVKSGLQDDLFQKPNSVPRVSQYRLTAHLTTAFTVYLAMLYSGLQILQTHKFTSNPALLQSEIVALSHPALRPLKVSIAILAALAFTTTMSGGLVAGLDAGLVYNEFPKMGHGYIPPSNELFNSFYSHRPPPHSDLYWRNLLENPVAVQFQHRCLAITTFFSILAVAAYSKLSPSLRKTGSATTATATTLVPRSLAKGIHGLVALALCQVTLGISTLIYMVPTGLAVLHQAGALAVLSQIAVLGVRVRGPGRIGAKGLRRGVTVVREVTDTGRKEVVGMGNGGVVRRVPSRTK